MSLALANKTFDELYERHSKSSNSLFDLFEMQFKFTDNKLWFNKKVNHFISKLVYGR
jgi:hypothetical protein